MFILTFLIGILYWFLILSMALLFDKKKNLKSIIFVSVVTLFVVAMIEALGGGGFNSMSLVMDLFIIGLFDNIIPLLICTTVIICCRLYTKKWFTKILPYIAGGIFLVAIVLYIMTYHSIVFN